jgi:predicted membrane chloride channel (bestrophin family)
VPSTAATADDAMKARAPMITEAIRTFFRIINLRTLLISLLSLLSTHLCVRWGVPVDIPSSILGVAIVFPIVFSINAAYRRREEALSHLASFKSHAAALYWAHRDWLKVEDMAHAARFTALLKVLFERVACCLRFERHDPDKHAAFWAVYRSFSDISGSLEALRRADLSASEVSRLNQYLRTLVTDFERLYNICIYRTPLSVRAHSRVFISTFPVVFGPYFAHVAAESFVWAGYGVSLLFSLVLVSLENIQDDLENPFDAVGVDDINLDIYRYYAPIFEASPRA